MLENTRAANPADTVSRNSPALDDRDSPLDLVHLVRQCQGDPGLEEELLGLFRRLAPSLVAQLSDPQMRLEMKANVAHKLRGSAVAIGAGRVARAAEAIEEVARSARRADSPGEEPTEEVSRALLALQEAVSEAVAQMDRLLG
jgi:HPt (histidine-containing phosphotransfer) domain-containing protein